MPRAVADRRLRGTLTAVGLFFTMLVMLMFWVLLIWVPPALLKILPIPPLQRACTHMMLWVVERWVGTNALLYRFWLPVRWQVSLPEGLDVRHSYLLVCNHQSWADILILFDVLHGRVPWLRFFLKRSLLWVPLVGFVCWAMDFPFMRRQARGQLNAETARKDLETTRRFCERFRGEPVTVVNFVEGTRFTEAKKLANQSPYTHLLRPKSGGLAFTLNAMGEQFAGVLDATIAYSPSRRSILASFLRGEQPDIRVEIRRLPVDPQWISGDYSGDPAFRARFQRQINDIWARKDRLLDTAVGV